MVYDQLLESFKTRDKYQDAVTVKQLVVALLLTVAFLVFLMILPMFEFFEHVILYPSEWGIFTMYLIGSFMITVYTMYAYGWKCYRSAYLNFRHYRLLNMDSLVSLGSISAFIMSVMLMIVYGIENTEIQESDMEKLDRIMMISSMFESTALILTVITIGKFFESNYIH
jgi:Cu+-exporting ATPase